MSDMEKQRKDTYWNKWLERHHHSKKCPYFDGMVEGMVNQARTECAAPWSNKCDGDVFKCAKLKYRYYASAK